ncbi:MAG: type IV toxin-antitoxin system AbiEi family antitoxin [Sulfurimonas sp.]|nr:type IV toxin-antitoxin system AbiEi family antitoxin [Sulfurimonas sp.]
MSLEKETKLKLLYQLLPEGVVVPSSWLISNGYSSQLIYKYIQNGWLKKISRGIYVRPASIITWQGIAIGIQSLCEIPFYIGGITALNIQGYAHYLPIGEEKYITMHGKDKTPLWIKQLNNYSFKVHKKPFFGELGLKKYQSSIRDLELIISSPERAILELLYLISDKGVSFQFAAEIFEGMSTLSPRLLNELLQNCDSMKVKKIFLFFAHYYNFAWFKYINKNITLGSGKLQVVKDGVYNKEYRLTIPKEFDVQSD